MKLFIVIALCLTITLGRRIRNPKTPVPTRQNDYTKYFPKGRNQDACGSCWAFSTAAYLSAFFKRTSYTGQGIPQISPEFFVDCNRKVPIKELGWYQGQTYGNDACDGGRPGLALIFAIDSIGHKFPLPTLEQYKPPMSTLLGFFDKQMTTRCNKYVEEAKSLPVPEYQKVLTNYHVDYKANITSNDQLRDLIDAVGPVIAQVNFDPTFMTSLKNFWKRKIKYFSSQDCGKGDGDHALIVAGYTQKMIDGEMKNVWIIRNSWENKKKDEGENEFIYFDADVANMCGIWDFLTFLMPEGQGYNIRTSSINKSRFFK